MLTNCGQSHGRRKQGSIRSMPKKINVINLDNMSVSPASESKPEKFASKLMGFETRGRGAAFETRRNSNDFN